jgi:acyl dehydratase
VKVEGSGVPGKALDEIRVGDSYAESVGFTTDRVDAFSALTGDFTGVHVEGGLPAQWGYSGRIVHGFLVSSFFSRILGTELPGAGAVIGSVSFQFHAPVYVGETVNFGVEVKRVLAPLRSVQLDMKVHNRAGARCVSGKATCVYPK